jgi:hypothetical protein
VDDLISRKVAIESIKDPVVKGFALYALKGVPSVPAVPLDKLCEWLNKNQGELPHCPFDEDCYECGLDGVACIKKRIKAWMEGLDAEVH